MTKICCVCKRVEHGDHWKNDYVFAPTERVSHGYCPLCFDVVLAEFEDSMHLGESQDENCGVISLGIGLQPACV
jgi:hypothetical protein